MSTADMIQLESWSTDTQDKCAWLAQHRGWSVEQTWAKVLGLAEIFEVPNDIGLSWAIQASVDQEWRDELENQLSPTVRSILSSMIADPTLRSTTTIELVRGERGNVAGFNPDGVEVVSMPLEVGKAIRNDLEHQIETTESFEVESSGQKYRVTAQFPKQLVTVVVDPLGPFDDSEVVEVPSGGG